MASVFKSLQQRPPNCNNHNMEALLLNYLHCQSSYRQSPSANLGSETLTPYTSVESPNSLDLVSSTQQTLADPDAIDTDHLLYLNNNLFLSPQLPFQDKQQPLVNSALVSYYPPLTDLPLQQTPQSLESWNNPILDVLQATTDLDKTYRDPSMDFNSNMDTSFLDFIVNDSNKDGMIDSSKCQVNLQVNSFTELKTALESYYGHSDPSSFLLGGTLVKHQSRRNSRYNLTLGKHEQEQQQEQQQQLLPVTIRDTVESTLFLASLMEKARSHWCCVGFKVAPITLEVIQNWRQAPITIVYCVASIALVTFMDHDAGQAYVKSAAMGFYEEARRKMDDIVFDDENDKSNYDMDDDGTEQSRQKAMTIQSYFCLSYTSNLLRLYEQQRTWGGLASIALQLRTKDAESGCRPMDEAILLCFCRWYYVDAWMALTLQRECLLPDTPPQFILDAIQSTLDHKHQSHFQFVMLAKFIRRYIQIVQSGKLMDPITMRPSPSYYQTTEELKQWYTKAFDTTSGNVHFHICYNATRLVILYKLLEPYMVVKPDDSTLVDGLETNLALLLALEQLASRGCDQSTYHHMFFAIHNTATRIHQHHTNVRSGKWQEWAKLQLQMNLVLLKGTQAYVNDVFQMRVYAKKIEQQFDHMGLHLSECYRSSLMSQQQYQQRCLDQREKQEQDEMGSTTIMADNATGLDQRHNTCHAALIGHQAASSKSKRSILPTVIPGMHVYKLHTSASIKKPRKSTAKSRITRK